MLVLSRKAGEVICIGDNVEIMVLEVRGERVRVGLNAPPEVKIRRQELPEHAAPREHVGVANGQFLGPRNGRRRHRLHVSNR